MLQRQVAWVLVFFTLAALTLRGLFVYYFLSDNPCMLLFDSGHYHGMAERFAQLGHFAPTDFYRLPGYPLFLGLIYRLCNTNLQIILALQVLLSACTVPLIYLLAERVTSNQRCALLAAGMSALSVGSAIYAGLIMTETLFVLFFLLFCYVLVGLIAAGSCRRALTAGVLLGMCSLIRPMPGIPLLVAILVLLFCSGPWRQRWLWAGSLLSTLGIVLSAWLLRNWLLTGMFFLQTLSGPHLLNHGAVRVYAMHHNMNYEQAQRAVYAKLPAATLVADQSTPATRALAFFDKSGVEALVHHANVQESFAARMLIKYLPETVKLSSINCCKTLFGLYSSELMMIDSGGKLPPYATNFNLRERIEHFLLPNVKHPWVRWVIYYELLLHLLLWLGAALFLWRTRFLLYANRRLLCLLLLAAGMVAVTAMCGFARFRLPLEPLMIIAVLF